MNAELQAIIECPTEPYGIECTEIVQAFRVSDGNFAITHRVGYAYMH